MATKKYEKCCKRGNRREEERDWTNLPEGIIAHIGEISLAHDLLPYISMRSVCHSWRQATKNPVNTNRRFRPYNWILIHPDLATNLCQTNSLLAEPPLVNTDNRQSGAFLFIKFSSGERIRANIPELHSHYIRACIDGLLLITEIDIVDSPTRLLNPFTGAMTEYPALSQVCSMYTPQSICFASSTASTLVILTGSQVAYAVPGLNKWKFVANRNPRDVIHVAHACLQSYTHVFSLAITGSGLKPCMSLFKVDEANPPCQVDLRIESLVIASINLGMAPRINLGMALLLWDVVSLVESDGEMLLLSRTWGKDGIIDFSFLRVFKVVIEEGVGGEEKAAHLVPLNSIGKHAIFINKAYGSLSVSTDVFPWIKPNSIYCYQANSLKMYHPGGLCCTSLDPNIAPPGYCYWLDPDDNIQFINESISVFPAFLSPTPRDSSPYQ